MAPADGGVAQQWLYEGKGCGCMKEQMKGGEA